LRFYDSTRRWENEPAAKGISIKDLDEDEIQLTLSNAIDAGRMYRPRKTDPKSILTGLGLVVDGLLTNAAVVLYCKKARLESFYPQCSIQMARFRGTDRLAEFDDNRQYWGHAFNLLQRAEFFINIIEWCKENRNPPPEWIIRSGSIVLAFKPSPEKAIQQPESQL
jgi:ATP-dependent DNA helicase RecG